MFRKIFAMRKNTVVLLLLVPLFFGSLAEAKKRKPWQKIKPGVSLGATHMLPSPYVMAHLQLALGTTVGMGLFDVAEISSNLYLDFQQVFNLQAKFNLVNEEDIALALWGAYSTQSVKKLNVDPVTSAESTQFVNVNSVEPGAVISYRLMRRLAGHTGVSHNMYSPTLTKSDLSQKSAFVRGTSVSQEFAYYLNKQMTVALGGSHDFTYEYSGVGASLHISGFHIGGHLFLDVKEGAFFPILSASYIADL